jgi:hypothetical protein
MGKMCALTTSEATLPGTTAGTQRTLLLHFAPQSGFVALTDPKIGGAPMTLAHSSRSLVAVLATLALAGPIAMGTPGTAHAAVPLSPLAAAPAQGPGFTQAVCDVVRSEGVSSAASTLISSGGGLVGALLAQVVVTAVKNNCTSLVQRAVKVVRSILATDRPPRTPAFSTLRTYLDALTARQVSTIASQLGVSTQYVLNARNAVCNAVRLDQNSAGVIAGNFPNARLRHLAAMNAFIRLAVDTCGGLSRADANFITGAVLNLVLGNEYQRDLDPPVVQIYRTAGQRFAGGVTDVTAWFRMFDRGGLRSCEIQLWYGGQWHSRAGGCSVHSARLVTGTRYAWAFRATDNWGHVSQWAVTYTGTA